MCSDIYSKINKMSMLPKQLPKIAVVANSIDAFSNAGKDIVEDQMRTFFQCLKNEAAISEDSILYPERLSTPHDVRKALDVLVPEKIDALVVLNSGFPNGNTSSYTPPLTSTYPTIAG